MSTQTLIGRSTLALALGLAANGDALAQEDHSRHGGMPASTTTQDAATGFHAGHAGMDHGQALAAGKEVSPVAIADDDADTSAVPSPAAIDHGSIDHSKMDHATINHSGMDHSGMDHIGMDHGTQAQPQTPSPHEPIPSLTDADREAAFPELNNHHMQHGNRFNTLLLVNRLEAWDADPGSGQAWQAQAWIGGDIHRFRLRSEGERVRGHTESSNLEALYGRSISPWWDLVAGIKQDFTPAGSQTWGAIGLQGMAPYKFEVSATAYLGQSGRIAATVEVEYELLLTNRLILQPLLEMRLNNQDDAQRQVGKGVSTLESGLRLRYEFSRRFAPYIGITHERSFGKTAALRDQHDQQARETRWVLGLRFWF